MTRNNKNASKLKKKNILANQLNFFLLGHSVVSYGCDLGQKMASGCNTLFLFYKRPVYKRHEAEICRNFKNKIRECPGWDSLLEIF